MQTQKMVWPAVFLTALFGMSMLMLWGVSVITSVTAIGMLFTKNPEAITSMIIAASSGFLGLILLAAAIIALIKIMGRETAEQNTRLPFAKWHVPAALLIATASIGIGGQMISRQYSLSVIFLPILTLSGVLAPLWIIMTIGTRRMELGPRWRAWGIFGLGMTLGPLLMIFLEVAAFIVILAGAIIYLTAQPELANQMMSLSTQLQTTNPGQMLNLFAPYLLKPTVIALLLTYTSLAIPMIEELFKPIGVWLFARQLKTPMAGFAMGILSGTAYALVENLGMTAQAGEGWPVIVIARAGAGLLHVANTGLMGWAIASLVNEKKVTRFFLTYITTIMFHGLWNSASMGFAIYSIAQELGKSYPWVVTLGTITMVILMVVFPTVLIVSNRKLTASNAAEFAAPAPSP